MLPQMFGALPDYAPKQAVIDVYEMAGLQYHMQRGFTFPGSCAVMANYYEESRYNPRVTKKDDAGPGKDSVGIGQDNQDRLVAMQRFTAALIGKPWQEGSTQELYYAELAYGVHELFTTHTPSRQILNMHSGGSPTLASEFGHAFEGFGAASGPRRDQVYARLVKQYASLDAPGAKMPDAGPSPILTPEPDAHATAPVVVPRLAWRPSPNFGSRRGIKVDMVIIHDTEGGYQGAIGTFLLQRGQRSVSAHFVVREDGLEVTQMVRLADNAWHAAAYNGRSVGIEMAGFLAKGYASGEWRQTAVATAILCHKYGIPVRWAQGGKGPGIARHFDLGAAGGGHFDPTQSLGIWQSFIGTVGSVYREMDAAKTFPASFGV